MATPDQANEATGATAIGPQQLASAGEWQIGEHRLNFGTLCAEHDGEQHTLAPKAMAVLLGLARNAGATVSRDQLMEMVWPNEYPTPDVLSQSVRQLRQALGSAVIQTVPRIGYRLSVPARALQPAQNREFIEVATAPNQAPKTAKATAYSQRPWKRFALVSAIAVVMISFGSWLIGKGPLTQAPAPALTATATRSAVTHLTSTLAAEVSPTLSPSGDRFAYVQIDWDTNASKVILSSIDGRQRVVLAHTATGVDTPPMWSRDGSRLLFQNFQGTQCRFVLLTLDGLRTTNRGELGPCDSEFSDHADWAFADAGIWLTRSLTASADPSLGTQIVFRDLAGVERPLRYQRTSGDFDLNPKQSPDGRWIAFRRGLFPRANLLLVASDGGETRLLTEREGYYGRFDWYSDSKHLLLSSTIYGPRELMRLNINSLQLDRLGVTAADDVDVSGNGAVFERVRRRSLLREYDIEAGLQLPSARASTGNDGMGVYAEDGRRSAFFSDRSGSLQVWLQSANDPEPVRISDFRSADLRDLSWSQNGGAISVISKDASSGDVVALIDPNNLNEVRILRLAHHELGSARLLANGAKIAYSTPAADGWQAYLADTAHPEKPVRLTELNTLTPTIQADGESLFLTDAALGQIIHLGPPYAHGSVVMTQLPQWTINRWRLSQGALWYLWLADEQQSFGLYRAPLGAPFQSDLISLLPGLRANSAFDVSADGKRALTRDAFALDHSDIGFVQLH